MTTRWNLKPKSQNSTKKLEEELGINPILVELLHQRGIQTFEEAKSFFRPNRNQIHDPFLMKDMDKAVERIFTAFEKNERILVYGDYDVDGTTAVSLVFTFLQKYHSELEYYIPNRYTEGYGISYQGIDYANENGFDLIIALDCGIKAIDKIDYANERNIDFIICDHHRPGNKIPNAVAILDPKREDCNYPYKELCGCGVGFKLIQAIAQKKGIPFEKLEEYFDLLAISIGADIVPITGENRTLAYLGLKRVNSNPRPGIAELLKLSNKKTELTITDLVFTIAPRINAAGRMKSGMNAVKLMVSGAEVNVIELGKFIENENADRKNFDKTITEEALSIIEQDEILLNSKTTVLYNENWHKGVIGIVCSRLIETHYRPTIILTESNGKAAGSARSVKGFDVYNAIDECSDLLEQFGGHMYAAGMTMPIENITAFQKKFEEVVSRTIDENLLTPEILIDNEIELSDLARNQNEPIPKFYRIIKQFAPFGPENMHPTFVTRNLRAKYCKIVGENHLKFTVYNTNDITTQFSAIGFKLSEYFTDLNEEKSFDLVYTIEENHWNGRVSLQFNVKDIRVL